MIGGSDAGDREPRAGIDNRPYYHPFRWLFLSGSRRSVTVLLSVLVLASLLAVGTLWELEMETLVRETRAVQSLFNTLLGGIILFVSVVLSINTAILAQEFAPLGTKQVELEESMAFRRELADISDSAVTPPEPRSFFLFLLDLLTTEADRLRESVATESSPQRREAITAFVDDVAHNVALVESRIRAPNRRLSAVLLAGLGYDIIGHIYTVERIQAAYRDVLTEAQTESLTVLLKVFKAFASGREYFRTLYYQHEMRSLSSDLLFLSFPVIVFTSYILLAIDAGIFPTATAFGIEPRLLYVSIAFAITLSPYVLLTAYMLRIVTVWKYSLGASEFTFSDVIVE